MATLKLASPELGELTLISQGDGNVALKLSVPPSADLRAALVAAEDVPPDDAVLPAVLDPVVPVILAGSPGPQEGVPLEEVVFRGVELYRKTAAVRVVAERHGRTSSRT